MNVRRDQWPVLIVNACYLLLAGAFYASKANYEFLLYIGVIIFFFAVIMATNGRVQYPKHILWGLTAWGMLHMAGGGVPVGEGVLYGVILIPISETYEIFRFDQFVHIVGFAVATLLMHHLLAPLLCPDAKRGTALAIVVVMAGLGVGALNEIVEFLAVVIVPETGVGGYVNTSLDLVSDLIGALLALGYLLITEERPPARLDVQAGGHAP